MTAIDQSLPQADTILSGPYWPEPVRVIVATQNGTSIRIQSVGASSGNYTDRTLTSAQFWDHVEVLVGGTHTFDASPTLFRLATEALRTHLAHVFDPQYAVSISQVDPLPHQLDAVYRHLLPQPTIRFLLADDPGAGKTIMAGLLMRELIQRQDVERVLVLCPKALTDQWRREMWDRFREEFAIVTGESISGLYGQNAWTKNDRIVASVDLAVQDHILPSIEKSVWDLIIFDEAHKLSAYRYGPAGKIDKTKRYQLAEKLAQQTRHLLLMTATPHKGDDENFRLLMSLLDDAAFASSDGLKLALKPENSPFFLRRMKESMRGFDGKPLFLPRHVDTIAYELSPSEQTLYNAVTSYVAHGLNLADTAKNRNVGLALTVLQRRVASSLHAITRSLERRKERLALALKEANALPGTVHSIKNIGSPFTEPSVTMDEDFDEDYDDLTPEQENIVSSATNARTLQELASEIAQLDGLIEMAYATLAIGDERKLDEFRRVVDSNTIADRNEKILVFTEHRDTVTHVTNKLREWGYTVTNIHGGMKLQDRIVAEKDFRGPIQFLVANDAAGEGINLQFCKIMINWDLPWNPNRLEQRMGRIHRYGQQFEVHVYNLVANTTREGQVLAKLMTKLEAIRKLLGHDQVYDVISTVLEGGQVRLDTLMRDAIQQRRSLDEIFADIDYIDTEAGIAAAKEALTEALATDNIDLTFIAGELRDSKERRLTPEYVEQFFVDAFRYLGGKIAENKDRSWRLQYVPHQIRKLAKAKHVGEDASEHRLVNFHKERLKHDPPAEFLAPSHPLFDVVVEHVLEEGRPALSTGAVFYDPQSTEPGIIWLLEVAAVNGDGSTIHRRMLALRQVGHDFHPVAPGVVLDLPPEASPPAMPVDLLALADPEAAIGAASGFYAGHYTEEITADQERQAQIMENALEKSAADSLDRLQRQLEKQFAQKESGKDMDIAIYMTNENISRLTNSLNDRRHALIRRRNIAIQTPRVVGVAAVLPDNRPQPFVAVTALGGDQSAIEIAAMIHVLAYEAGQGRIPVDVSRQSVGYDIRSEASDGSVRYIEVKGHQATGSTTLYYTEWQTAHRMRDEFFIYTVDFATSNPDLWIVQDPVGHGIEPVQKVVQYQIDRDKLVAISTEMIGTSL